MNNCACIDTEQFWQRVDEVKGRELLVSVIGAAKAEVEYSRAFNASRRAAILLGGKAEQGEYQLKAEILYRKRNSQLRSAKHLLAKLVESIDDTRKKDFAQFLRGEGLKQFITYAKQTIALRLLSSDITPEETTQAVKHLDDASETLRGMASLEEINNYAQMHLDELIGKKMGNPSYRSWCIFLLLLTSALALLLAAAVVLCALSSGKYCEDMWDRIVDYVCGPA